jgi:adenylate cyclase
MASSGDIERRLAAILAADVVGYSRLMGTDEVGTMRALKMHRRELIDLQIAAHHGRIFKTRATACWSSSPASSMPWPLPLPSSAG